MIKTIKVCEIFASIQGESTLQGLPCVFVRLSGCNLNCSYCDTRYAQNEGNYLSASEIFGFVNEYGIPCVCLTGGEPLLQSGAFELAKMFLEKGFKLSVETNGTIDASVLPSDTIRVIDIKCPGSGEEEKTHPNNLSHLRKTDEFKFVIRNREDFDYAVNFIHKNGLLKYCTVLISPVSGTISNEDVARWILKELPEARLNLQLHRFIWPGISRGK